MKDFYENISDIHIVNEGHQNGYFVKLNDAHTYHLNREDIEYILERLHDVVISKGNIANWEKI